MSYRIITAAMLMATGTFCQAQQSITIYGAFDLYTAQQRASGGTSRTVVNSGFSPNALGFTGSEDLGGGLRVGFLLEGQPALDTGTFGQGGKMFGRQSLVYASGDWGRISAGRLHTAGRAFIIKYAATGWLTTDPIGNLDFAMGAGISPAMNADGNGGRASNAISYSSPTFSGISFSVLQSAREGGLLSNGQIKVTVLGIGYVAGPLSADAVVSHLPAVPGSQIEQLDYALGATYDLGYAKLMAAFQAKKGSAVATTGSMMTIAGSEATDRFVVLGVQIPIAKAGQLGISVGRLQVADAHRNRRAANISAPFASVMDSATAWSVAYTHFLSKRTSLFAAYGRLDNAAAGTASLAPDLRPVAGGSSNMLGVGIRHSF